MMVELFSRRQLEILNSIARGRSMAEVAKEVGISIHTVRVHIDRIKDKTRTRGSRNALLLWTGRHGFPRELPKVKPK